MSIRRSAFVAVMCALTLLSVLLFPGCSEEFLTGTAWTGSADGGPDGIDIDAFFFEDKAMGLYMDMKSAGSWLSLDLTGKTAKLSGDISISGADIFSADLSGSIDLDNDGAKEDIDLKLSGNLNNVTGAGSGTYSIKISSGTISFDNKENNDDGWQLTKVK